MLDPMRVAGDLKCHYLALGIRGVFLGAKAHLLRRTSETLVSIPGIAHPIHLRLRTSDVPLFLQVILLSQYEWKLPKRPSVIVDAGANIGLASIFFANRYPGAKIISIEPAPSNLKLLCKNMAQYPNNAIVAGALWKENSRVTIVDPGGGEWGFQVEEDRPADGNVMALTLDRLMDQFGIDYVDLLKVDIEGAEKEVFESSSQWIDRVGAIAIELHDEIKIGCSHAFREATRAFGHESRKGETIFVARNLQEEPTH
jgi:FkbM family methyltransferase